MIDHYSFGKISINSKIYRKDLIILGSQIHNNWWREKGHNITLDDISLIVDYQPDILFIGTGKFGMMKVSDQLIQNLHDLGIDDVIIEKSSKAVDRFNHCKLEKKVLAIHLTC